MCLRIYTIFKVLCIIIIFTIRRAVHKEMEITTYRLVANLLRAMIVFSSDLGGMLTYWGLSLLSTTWDASHYMYICYVSAPPTTVAGSSLRSVDKRSDDGGEVCFSALDESR